MVSRKQEAGFTLVEVMVVALVISVVILASSQATIYFVKHLKTSEQKQLAVGESHELDSLLRRANKNLNTSRLNMPTTFRETITGPFSMGNNPAPPRVSMVIDKTVWFANATGHPLYTSAAAAMPDPTYNLILDSFTLEEHTLVSVGSGLEKRTRRILASRCDVWSRDFDTRTVTQGAGVTAAYVLAAMTGRPFLWKDSSGSMQLNCCPPTNPRCANAGIGQYFFRAYAITLGNAGEVLSVEEFPKTDSGKSALGAGFGLYFQSQDGATMSLQSFAINSTCYDAGRGTHEACRTGVSLREFFGFASGSPEIVKIQTRNMATSVSNNILQTGVISL